jgi:hypothetical protein
VQGQRPGPSSGSLSYKGLRYESRGGARGRVVAEIAFSRGDRVLYEEPFAYALSAADGTHASYCHGSLQSAREGRLHRCSGCKYAHYSSVSEQRRAWPRHRLECARIARAIRHGHTPSSLVLLAGRVLDCTVVPPDANTGGTWDDLQDLELRYGELPDDQMAFLSQVAYCVRDYMGAGPGAASIHIPPQQPAALSRATSTGAGGKELGGAHPELGTQSAGMYASTDGGGGCSGYDEHAKQQQGKAGTGHRSEEALPHDLATNSSWASQARGCSDNAGGGGGGGGGGGETGADVSMRTVLELLMRISLSAFTLLDGEASAR